MTIRNVQLDIDALPRAATIQWQKLDPSYPRQAATSVLFGFSIIFIPLIIAASVFIVQWLAALLVAGLYLVVTLPITTLVWAMAKRRRIAIREHDIGYQKGIFWRSSIFAQIHRVQHMEVSSGVIERRFKLNTVKFFTAGGATADLSIPGLDAKRTEQLRALIVPDEKEPLQVPPEAVHG